MLDQQVTTTGSESAFARSVIFRAIAAGLRPPASRAHKRHAEHEGLAALSGACVVLDETTPHESGVGPESTPFGALAEKLCRARQDGAVESLSSDFLRLFGHTAQGRVIPYETEYGSGDVFRQTGELADLAGFYRAAGLCVPEDRHERVDHAATECEFMSFLALKEGWAFENGNGHDPAAAVAVQRAFLRDHLGRFGCAFAGSLRREAGHEFYRALAALASEFLAFECRRLDVPIGPEYLEIRSDQDDGLPMGCESSCSLLAGGG
jgi:TorA maturation chaperone TorD